MKNLLTVFLPLLLASCSTAPLAFDSTLIRPYTFALEKEPFLNAPYVAKYEKDGKVLLYIAAIHLTWEKNSDLLEHPTLQTIQKVFKDRNPEVVIVEGLKTADELSPKSMFAHTDECDRNRYRGCGEGAYAINLARRRGSHFITGEPSEKKILEEIQKEGYRAEDLLGFYLARQIPQLKGARNLQKTKFSKQANDLLRSFEKPLRIAVAFGFNEFE